MTKTHKLFASVAAIGILVLVSLWFKEYLQSESTAIELIQRFSYLGVYLTALIGGLSAVVPIPPAVFTPIFEYAGLSVPLIIIFLSLGTFSADIFGFFLGSFNHDLTKETYPKTFAWFQDLYEHRAHLVLPAVFLYAAFIPFPNELIVISLGALGYTLRPLILPLFFGSIVHHTLISYGAIGLLSIVI